MRVLFLSNFYPPYELGGYEQWCHEVATRLKERGHEVKVLTSRYGSRADSSKGTQDVNRSLYLQTDIAYYRPVDFFLRRPYQERANKRALHENISRFSPDVTMVWGMWNLSHTLPAWVERYMPGRVAYYISSYWPMDMDPHTAYWQLPTRRPALDIIKRPLRNLALAILRNEGYPPQLRFQQAVCCSNYVRDTLVDAGYLPSSSRVLLGGTDVGPFLEISRSRGNRLGGEDGILRLLYFGRLIHDKGVHTAIEAVGLLKQQGLADGIELTILGSGHPEYEAKLRQMVVESDIKNQVKFVSQVNRREIPTWLGRHDVYLFTSIWPEPMARSVMEAMAAGLVVIGTEVGGQVEMLSHGRNGLTYQAEDAETLASRIAQIFDNPEMRLELATAGQQMIIMHFALDRMVNEIELYLHDIVNNASVSSS